MVKGKVKTFETTIEDLDQQKSVGLQIDSLPMQVHNKSQDDASSSLRSLTITQKGLSIISKGRLR